MDDLTCQICGFVAEDDDELKIHLEDCDRAGLDDD